MSLAPGWLYNLSRVNPFSYVADGVRAAFRGEPSTDAFVAGTTGVVVLAMVVRAVAGRTAGTSGTAGTQTVRRESS